MIRSGRLRDAKSIAGLLYYNALSGAGSTIEEKRFQHRGHREHRGNSGEHLHLGWTGVNYENAGASELFFIF